MSEPSHQKDKLEKKIKLLESELTAIKGSASYRIARTAGTLRSKVRKDPVGVAKKLLSTGLHNPRRLVRLARGGEHNTGLAANISNRTADYHSWILLSEPSEQELAAQRKTSKTFAQKPLISILTPVFDPPLDVLTELIESALEQTYPYLELCLGNFGKSDAVMRLLTEYAERDPRVKVYEFSENLGIAGNSNLILDKVQGEFVALLDHDDTLSPDALYENVKLINEDNYDFIYSDKDMIDDKGNRYDPLFKADLSPETMLNANYFTHLNVMRTAVVRSVGGWDSKTDGAQDWDLFLKIMHATTKIAHIPKVLYHWRVIATSTALSIDTKPYALAGQRHAVQKYMDAQGIKAAPYHNRTELLLTWRGETIDQQPLLVVQYHSSTDTARLLSRLLTHMPAKTQIAVLHEGVVIDDADEALLRRRGVRHFVGYEPHTLARTLKVFLDTKAKKGNYDTVVFANDQVRVTKDFEYTNFAGWLSVPGVGAVGVKVMGQDHTILDCGAVLTQAGAVPIFHGYPSYYQGYLGNVEWVRNLHAVSQDFFACTREALEKAAIDVSWDDEVALLGLTIAVGKHQRLVSYPKAVVFKDEDPFVHNQTSLLPVIRTLLNAHDGVDPYGNPNVHTKDPMRLSTDTFDEDTGTNAAEGLDQYQHDALILTQTFDITDKQIRQNLEQARKAKPTNLKTVGWFLPSFDAIYAGLNNIFSFAEYMHQQGMQVRFFILKGEDSAEAEQQLVAAKFPGLLAEFVAIRPDTLDKVPALDIGICTQWATAYPLAQCANVRRKCYFIQDNEPNFYPMGSVSALADLTYRWGFYAIANTDGLLDMYQKQYGGRGTVLKSLVSLDAYYPREDRYYTPAKPYRVFFYGRPNMPRNAFELGLAGFRKLKEQLGDDVQVIAAGAAWNPADYGVEGIVENLGKIPYEAVPDLYRSIDAGVMFMFSGHPGVTASELMASGCPTVVNEYDDATWNDLYQHEKTCLVSVPTASEIARNIRRCLEDGRLRRTLIDGGLKKTKEFYAGYEASLSKTFAAIKKG
jgi:glycosyltransferase involved in cell wall biosynthesis